MRMSTRSQRPGVSAAAGGSGEVLPGVASGDRVAPQPTRYPSRTMLSMVARMPAESFSTSSST